MDNKDITNTPVIKNSSPLGFVDFSLETFNNVNIWAKINNKVYDLGKNCGGRLRNDFASKLKVINGFEPKNFKLFDALHLEIQSSKKQYTMLMEALNESRKIDIALMVNFPENHPVCFVLYNLFTGELRHDFVFNKESNTACDRILLTLYADSCSFIRQQFQSNHTKANENFRLTNMFCRLVDAQDEYFERQAGNKPERIQTVPRMLQLEHKPQE